jgi:hypothetical protein
VGHRRRDDICDSGVRSLLSVSPHQHPQSVARRRPRAIVPTNCRRFRTSAMRVPAATSDAGRRRRRSTRSSQSASKAGSRIGRSLSSPFRRTSNGNCGHTSPAASSASDSAGHAVRRAGRVMSWPSHARAAASVPPATAGTWPRPPHISPITSSRRCPCSRSSTATCRATFGVLSACCDTAPGRPLHWSGSPSGEVGTAASPASAMCSPDTGSPFGRPTGSARARAEVHAPGGQWRRRTFPI